MDALFAVPEPYNEPVRSYAPDTADSLSLRNRLASSPRSATNSQ